MVRRGEADALICGTIGRFHSHLSHVSDIIGRAPTVHAFSTVTALVLQTGTIFIADSEVTVDPTDQEVAPTRRLRGLGDRQRKALLEKFDFS